MLQYINRIQIFLLKKLQLRPHLLLQRGLQIQKAHGKKDSIGWWWEYPDGSYATNTWLQINNYWYYFNNDGYMLVGWRYINNEWYYLNPGSINGIPFGAMATGWQSIYSENYEKNFDYYFGPDGDMKDSPS